jgi:hypothetical protein
VSGFLSLDSRILLEGPLAELLSLRGFDEAAVTSADAATKASVFATLITQSCNVCANQRRPTRLL